MINSIRTSKANLETQIKSSSKAKESVHSMGGLFLESHAFVKSEQKSRVLLTETLSNELTVVSKAKKQRFTVETKNCLRFWFNNGKLVSGCTTAIDPDGQDSGKEWCNLQESDVTPNGKNWGYCTEDMDWDQVRQAVSDFYEEDLQFMNKLSLLMASMKPTVLAAISKLQSLQKEQFELVNDLENMSQARTALEQQFSILRSIVDKIKGVNVQITEVQKQIDLTPEVNPFSLKYWCQGLSFYEEESQGDGFTGEYFDNEFFMGKSELLHHTELEFNWQGEKPHEDINDSDFSVIYVGLIMAPINDNYYFHIHADAAVQLKINDEIVIDHFFSDDHKGYKGAEWSQEVKSDYVTLNSGMLYQFEVRYWRTPAHEFKVIDKSFLIIEWSSDKLP